MIRTQNVCFIYKHNMAANVNVNYDLIHNKQLALIMTMQLMTGRLLKFLLVDEFSLEEVEVGQVHVSTSSEDAIQELEGAFSF